MASNSGIMRVITRPTITSRTGMLTSSSPESPTSWRRASTMPPTMVIGAAASRVADMSTSICTCWTSLVMRVMSDAAPKVSTSWSAKSVTRWKSFRRTSRPKRMAALDP